jgi:hypothetical protein
MPAITASLSRLDALLSLASPGVLRTFARLQLARAWRFHVRDYDFENYGLEHAISNDQGVLMRSPNPDERRDFASWLARNAHGEVSAAALEVLRAKNARESYTERYVSADLVLTMLDGLGLPNDPVAALASVVRELRTSEPRFLEHGTETIMAGEMVRQVQAPRSDAWAFGLAIAARPSLLGLARWPVMFSGVGSRELFRAMAERAPADVLGDALVASLTAAEEDFGAARQIEREAESLQGELRADSKAPDTFRLVRSYESMTRAEIARALGVTIRTASLGVSALQRLGCCVFHEPSRTVRAVSPW